MGNAEEERLFLRRPQSNDDGFQASGVCHLGPSDQEDVAVARVTDAERL